MYHYSLFINFQISMLSYFADCPHKNNNQKFKYDFYNYKI